MEPLEVINQRLLDTYGRGVNDLPTYRVVWSTTERETRVKHIVEGSGIIPLIANDLPKYPMFPDCWVLENAQANTNNPELMTKVSYEPLWMFYDPNYNPLPYDWDVIQKIIYFHIHRVAPKTASMLDHEYEESKLKEGEEILDHLQHDEAFPNKMYDTSVVSVPKEYDNVRHN